MSGIPRDLLRQMRILIRPLQVRLANSIARAVVQLVSDGKKLQILQIGVHDGEDVDDAERFQEYGFSSVPQVGAEAVVLFPNGDRSHPLVIAVDDRTYRPTGGQPGEVTVYASTGAKIKLEADGDIEVQPAPGREVFIRSAGGSADRLVKKSEFDAHVHVLTISAASGSGGTGTAAPPTAVTGTTKLKAE